MIHSMAEENWSKRKGALRKPKGRTISKKYRPSHFIPRSSQSEGCTGILRKAAFMSSLDIIKAPWTKFLEYGNGMVDFNVLERVSLGGNVGVYTGWAVFGVGEVEYGTPLQGMLHVDGPNGVDL